jgi:RNA polymerase sigma factor (sigma-70 family)
MTCMGPGSESALVAGLRAGDCAAFDELYDRFNRPLFNFLARLTRRRDVAEDLLEETWVRLIARAPELRADTRIRPWLYTVARNLYVSYQRSRALEDSHAPGLVGWPCPSASPSPFDSAVATEAERRIDAALAELPLVYREALLLAAVEGMRPAEAAEVCGIKPEAMRQRLRRARALLARHLEEGAGPRLAALREATT